MWYTKAVLIKILIIQPITDFSIGTGEIMLSFYTCVSMFEIIRCENFPLIFAKVFSSINQFSIVCPPDVDQDAPV